MDDLFRELGAFTVAVAMSLGLGRETGAVPDTTPLPQRQVAPARHVVARTRRAVSWMDYIDFRRGSGDVLRWVGSETTSSEPHHCGQHGRFQ